MRTDFTTLFFVLFSLLSGGFFPKNMPLIILTFVLAAVAFAVPVSPQGAISKRQFSDAVDVGNVSCCMFAIA